MHHHAANSGVSLKLSCVMFSKYMIKVVKTQTTRDYEVSAFYFYVFQKIRAHKPKFSFIW